MGRHILSQISSDENTENTDLETTVFFDINIRVPCKIGSLDAMALKLRNDVMPVLAEQLGQFMIKVDTLIKDSAERKKDGYTINETVPIIIDNKPKGDENKAKNQNENLVKCPVCGKLQKRFRTDCWSCGTKLTDGQ